MGYDVCVYNSYTHRSISCSGFRRRCESEPYEDRREIVRKSKGIRTLKVEIVRSPCGVNEESIRLLSLAVSLRSPCELCPPNYDKKTVR